MMTMRTLHAAVLAGGLALAGAASGAGFADVLSQPATMTPLASKSLLQGIARAGNRLVAVGQRGHVVVSTDGGETWKQSPVPVSSDLTAVHFVDDRKGWAVGHDGVILATADAGATWTLQLDGQRANAALLADIERKAAAQPASDAMKALLAEAKRNVEQGADKPFLDVWFADASTGYAVGAFNLIFRTADGGKTWEPWFDRTENPKFLNLYAVRPAGGALFVVGEAGLVLKLDPAAQRLRAVDLPYKGTLFGVLGGPDVVLVYGLRGNVFRSEDAGKSWTKVENTGLPATIAAGAMLADGGIALGDVSGRVARSGDGGRAWRPVPLPAPTMVAGMTDAGGGKLAVVGPRGAATAPLATP